MPDGIDIYGARLFNNTCELTRHIGHNTPPEPGFGNEGMDEDVAKRLGYMEGTFYSEDRAAWIPGYIEHKGTNKNRMQGICCGISTGWMAAFLGGNIDATAHGRFRNFFQTLRFQGAHGKDFGDLPHQQGHLLRKIMCWRNLPLGSLDCHEVTVGPTARIPFTRFEMRPRWVGYVSTCGHAIAIGHDRARGRYYIMDPNGGLFEYDKQRGFTTDLGGYLTALWAEGGAGRQGNPAMDIYIYYKSAGSVRHNWGP